MVEADSDDAQKEPPRGRSAWRLAFGAALARVRFLALLAAVLAAGAFFDRGADAFARWRHGSGESANGSAAFEFVCPMHPAVVRAAPASCPSCAMPLSRRTKGAPATLPAGTAARVTLSPYRIAQAGIVTKRVGWRPLVHTVRASGVLRYEEGGTRRYGTGFVGRVTSIDGTTDGARVAKGAALVRIASAEVQSVTRAYAAAVRGLRDARDRSATSAVDRLRSQSETQAKQLLAWGFDRDQLALLEAAGNDAGDDANAGAGSETEDVAIRAPFDCVVLHCDVSVGQQVVVGSSLVHVADPSRVVALLDVPREDAAALVPGVEIALQDPRAPGRSFAARVAQIAPYAEEATQTVLVRAALTGGLDGLRVGAPVAAECARVVAELEPWRSAPRPPASGPYTVYECPMHSLVRTEPGKCDACGGMILIPRDVPGGPQPGTVLAVPESAVIDTGTASFVFVESAPGVFDARPVRLGMRCGAWFPVISGLAEGDRVASAGAFLLDAETRLDPAAAAAYFGATQTGDGAGAGDAGSAGDGPK